MSKRSARYRVGIDVGLFSVGCAAIEIDDSSDNPRDAMPLSVLAATSIIHDGAIDPAGEKSSDSRKMLSGVARRTRRLHRRRKERLLDLDSALCELGYPVEQARELVGGSLEEAPYLPWRARVEAATGYIENDHERKLAVAIALRHIARHRGWRNPYSSIHSLKESSQTPSEFYIEFAERIVGWLESYDTEGRWEKLLNDARCVVSCREGHICDDRPTAAQLVEPLLAPLPTHRIRNNKPLDQYPDALSLTDNMLLGVHIGKLHQSDAFYEVTKILLRQKASEAEARVLLNAIFKQVNPKETGAAAKLVAKDDLQPERSRASRASLAFQEFRILTTIANLRVREDGDERALSFDEKQKLADYLMSDEAACNPEISWSDAAETLGVPRNALKGVGGADC